MTYTREQIEAVGEAITVHCESATDARGRRMRPVGDGALRFSCPGPAHRNGDANPSATWSAQYGTWRCHAYGCHETIGHYGTDLAPYLGIESPASADFTPEQRDAMRADAERRRAERDAEQAQRDAERVETLAELVASGYVERCVSNALANPNVLAARGIDPNVAALNFVGIDCADWPGSALPWGWRSALVLPWIAGGTVLGIQYRNLDADSGERYRWHRTGQGKARLYNSTLLKPRKHVGQPERAVVVEGAIKALALASAGIQAVGLYNASAHDQPTVRFLRGSGVPLVFAPDPDAYWHWRTLANECGASITRMPDKPDDLIARHGAWFVSALIEKARAA